jgi:hypothetical protein
MLKVGVYCVVVCVLRRRLGESDAGMHVSDSFASFVWLMMMSSDTRRGAHARPYCTGTRLPGPELARRQVLEGRRRGHGLRQHLLTQNATAAV